MYWLTVGKYVAGAALGLFTLAINVVNVSRTTKAQKNFKENMNKGDTNQ